MKTKSKRPSAQARRSRGQQRARARLLHPRAGRRCTPRSRAPPMPRRRRRPFYSMGFARSAVALDIICAAGEASGSGVWRRLTRGRTQACVAWPQSRQINPNRGPSRAPTGLNPPPSPSTPLYWERRLISCFCFASHVGPSSDGPPALVAHSPCRASPALFGRDAVKARDALLGQYPLGQPRGVRRRGYSPRHRPRDAHSVETTPDV